MELAPTDYDLLVRRGFDPDEVSQALRLSQGNMRLAICFLTRHSTAESGWMDETDEDWLAGTPNSALSLSASNRALIKSPLYIRVLACERIGENIYFKLIIIERSGRQHDCKMRLSEIFSLRNKLPFTLIAPFDDKFPTKSLTWKGSPEGIEKKRLQVEDWFRALCSSEQCMTNKPLIDTLYTTFGIMPAEGIPSASPSDSGAVVVRLVDNRQDWEAVPEHTLSMPLPMKLNVFAAQIPCKISSGGVFRSPEDAAMVAALCAGEADKSDAQLIKDFARDRLVINGKRIVGSMHKTSVASPDGNASLASLLASVQEVLTAVLKEGGCSNKFSKEQLQHFCFRALKQASRTNSAFQSHMALHQVVSLEDYPGDLKIVPESTLAKPLLFHFSIAMAPIPNAPPVLRCDVQGTTVYRFCVGDLLETVLQLRVTYCKTLREMPQTPPLRQGLPLPPSREAAPLSYRNGNSDGVLIFQRDTTTTSRDWTRG